MAKEAKMPNPTDIQVFNVGEALGTRDGMGNRIDMATSPNCYIAAFGVASRGGETRVHSHPDSDQILFILKGECTAEGLSGRYVLESGQGVLIPSGVNYGFTNEADDELVFLSMRTEASGGRRVAYVPSVPSDVGIKIPAAMLNSQGIGSHLYVYALDSETIGVSPLLLDDWNRGSVLRMECTFEKRGEDVVAVLPERLAYWYRVDDLADSDYTIEPDADGTRVRINITPAIKRQLAR